MIIAKSVEWTKGDFAIACDFDSKNRLAALVKLASGTVVAQIDGTDLPIPMPWTAHVKKIRWLGEAEVVLWPVCLPMENPSYVGRIGLSGTSILNLGFPLDIFTDREFLACTFPEERISISNDPHSDLISVFSCNDFVRLAGFIEPFLAKFRNIALMEVDHGVLDGNNKYVWFSAYDTGSLWCFSFETSKILICDLGCSRDDVLAISCNGDRATVIFRDSSGIFLRTFIKIEDHLTFEAELQLSLANEQHPNLWKAISSRTGCITGHAGNRIALTTSNQAILASF
jgi:hypothetical protein